MKILNRYTLASTLLLFSVLFACEKENSFPVDSFLQSLEKTKYYDQEFLPHQSQYIYGIWKLAMVSGGLLGSGYDTDLEYLEVKSFGIYGLVRGDTVFEYGKIELVPFTYPIEASSEFRFTADYYTEKNSYFNSTFIVFDNKQDTLNMNTVNPDGYSYHFNRVK